MKVILFIILLSCEPKPTKEKKRFYKTKQLKNISFINQKTNHSKWYYISSDSTDIHQIELNIDENGLILGRHVFVFNNGLRIDASLKKQISITGHLIKTAAEIDWQSSFCEKVARVKLIFASDSTLIFRPITDCSGDIGQELIFKKEQINNAHLEEQNIP
jgi:hypothetical protein